MGETEYVVYFSPAEEELRDDFNAFLGEFKQTDEYEDFLRRCDDFDPYALASELKLFLGKYRHDTAQMQLMPKICDELLYPVFIKGIDRAEIRLMCSSDDKSHMLTVKFPGIESDPLRAPYLDELNLRLLEHDSEDVFSRKADSGYKVCFNF